MPVKAYWLLSGTTAILKQEAFGILYGLVKFNHYFFTKEVCMITDHKPLVAVVSRDVPTMSKQLQCIMMHIHQYRICILYKPGQAYT